MKCITRLDNLQIIVGSVKEQRETLKEALWMKSLIHRSNK